MIDAKRETTRTLVCIALGVGLGFAAWLSRPKITQSFAETWGIGEQLFPTLTDPAQVKALEVLEYVKQRDAVKWFRVEHEKGGWVIPSKDNYPADAERGVADATTWLIGLRKESIAAPKKDSHAELGVLDPEEEQSAATGVGTRVRLFDSNKNELADLILGNEVEGRTGFRYVRQPKHDEVYRVNVGTYALSTQFKNWLKTDLLELGWDAKFENMTWTEYSFPLELPTTPKVTKAVELVADSTDQKNLQLKGVTDKEETKRDGVQDLIDALRNLQLVDVVKKPAGLKPDLRMEQGQLLALAMARNQGFFVDRKADIIPTDGEMRFETDKGVVYKLLFGKEVFLADGGSATDAKKDGKAKGKDDKKPETTKSRYLMVSVGFNEGRFPPIPDPAIIKPEPVKLEPPKADPKKAPADVEKEKKAFEEQKKKAEEDAKKRADDDNERHKADVKFKRETRGKDIEKNKKTAEELAERYAGWYYLASSDSFQKLKVDREKLVKAKEVKPETTPTPPSVIPPVPAIGGNSHEKKSAPAPGKSAARSEKGKAAALPSKGAAKSAADAGKGKGKPTDPPAKAAPSKKAATEKSQRKPAEKSN